jgi:hypothetical protein
VIPFRPSGFSHLQGLLIGTREFIVSRKKKKEGQSGISKQPAGTSPLFVVGSPSTK